MRLAAQAKSGFYPAAPEAVRLMLKHLSLPPPPKDGGLFRSTDIAILDPWQAKAKPSAFLLKGFLCPRHKVHGVELNKERAEAVRLRLPDAKVIGPCSYFGTEISVKSFSLVYCNPPFDYDGSGSGTREEQNFVQRSYDLLAKDGILILVCPIKVIIGRYEFAGMMDSMFEHIEIYRFPDAHRPYNEVVVFGKKRTAQLDRYDCADKGDLRKRGWHDYAASDLPIGALPELGDAAPNEWKRPRDSYYGPKRDLSNPLVWRSGETRLLLDMWQLPFAWAPKRFNKLKLTDEEKLDLLSKSPLWHVLDDPEPEEKQRSWMLPAKNHTVMLMVSGLLDGAVPTDPPHVIRGVYFKKERKPVITVTENVTTGASSETQVYVEEPVSKIRMVEVDEWGEPHLFELRSDAAEGDGDADPEDEEDCD